jgi:hypothetical protein
VTDSLAAGGRNDTTAAVAATVSTGCCEGRVFVFHRAPMLETAADVAAWLESKGYGASVRVFRGPDGSWRGSGACDAGAGG